MSTLEAKKAVAKELVEKLQSSEAVYLTNYKGMTVAEVNKLRRELHKAGISYKVYKNKLVKRALEEVGGYDELHSYLVDQTAYAFVDADVSKPAKVLKDFIKENKKPQFKAAFIDGTLYKEDELESLSAMKSRDEVIGDIIGLLMAPLSNVVSALQAQGSNIVGAVKTIAEKEES